MTVVDLAKFFIIDVFKEEVHHLLVHFLLFLDDNWFLLVVSCWSVDCFYLTDFSVFRNQSLVPADEEVVTVQVRTADLRGKRNFAFFWENDAVQELLELVVHTQFLESGLNLLLTYTLDPSNVCWIEAWISGYDSGLVNDL